MGPGNTLIFCWKAARCNSTHKTCPASGRESRVPPGKYLMMAWLVCWLRRKVLPGTRKYGNSHYGSMLNMINQKTITMLIRFLSLLYLAVAAAPSARAIPYFARKYDVRCSQCHAVPPMLNAFGQRFVANGYKLPELPAAEATIPVAVWASYRGEVDQSRDRAKVFPNRVELISADSLSPWLSYFVEWRALSYQTTGTQRLVARHGRFEDVFLQFLLPRVSVTAGQFRMLNQWDVSRRLTLSEPAAFSSGIGGPPALDTRLRSLRSFSWSGRAPAVRATVQALGGDASADGWFHELTLPFSGELTLPVGEESKRNASFSLEARPKGFVYETYYRKNLSSIGTSLFVGNDRRAANLTGVLQAGRHAILATAGTVHFRQGHNDFRLSVGDTWVPREWLAAGLRLDHVSAARIRPAIYPHINLSFPGGKYTFLVTLEQRIQQRNHGFFAELGTVFLTV